MGKEHRTTMNSFLTDDPFVWVTVIDPGPDEHFLGLHDDAENLDFIPVFREKDDAMKCYHFMARDPQRKYEIQAVRYLELCQSAAAGGFVIFLLDGNGRVVEKQPPAIH
jgi:hypothetical protein